MARGPRVLGVFWRESHDGLLSWPPLTVSHGDGGRQPTTLSSLLEPRRQIGRWTLIRALSVVRARGRRRALGGDVLHLAGTIRARLGGVERGPQPPDHHTLADLTRPRRPQRPADVEPLEFGPGAPATAAAVLVAGAIIETSPTFTRADELDPRRGPSSKS
jgi:hypothetical protein